MIQRFGAVVAVAGLFVAAGAARADRLDLRLNDEVPKICGSCATRGSRTSGCSGSR